jgi:membrane-associated phospholipid phosphatase
MNRRRLWWLAGLFVAGLVVLTIFDKRLFFALRVEDRAALEGRDWYQAARAMGYLPVWLAAGAAIALHDAARRGGRVPARGGVVALAPALAGLLAEALKVVIPRQRPISNGVGDGEYVWGVPFEALRGVGNHGLASSHAAVAFGAAFVLARLYPASGFVLVPLAALCALTRLWAGAHFASDVYVGAWLGLAAAWALTARGGGRP